MEDHIRARVVRTSGVEAVPCRFFLGIQTEGANAVWVYDSANTGAPGAANRRVWLPASAGASILLDHAWDVHSDSVVISCPGDCLILVSD
jgi:hypothetical protein